MRWTLPLAVALVALAFPAAASAIVNGSTVAEGSYPAHGFLGIDTSTVADGQVDAICSGTLIGSRQFLTAARCTTNSLGLRRSVTRLTVRIGEIPLPGGTVTQNVAENDIPDADDPPNTDGGPAPGAYVRSTGRNDIAVLTLTEPVDATPVRVVDENETAAWAPGTLGGVLGWGETEAGVGDISETLLHGDVTVRADADCPGDDFDASVMFCAAGTPAAGNQNPCASDSGSPLLVPDGTAWLVAGVFSGAACATTDAPAVFARVGADPLNGWVHDRTPEANFELSHQPRATEPVTLTSTSTYPPPGPDGDDFFDTVRWDLDGDRQFDDATGKQISHAFPAAGTAIVGIEASNKAEGDRASAYFSFPVEAAPSGGGTTTTPTPPPTTRPPVTRAPGPRATILVSGRPRVRNRRFPIRIRFARTAPAGTAVVEVYRGKRRIGIARTRVRRGATKRVRVRLTPQGRRMLRRADSRRLRIRVRVRVGRDVLRTKRITIRR
jgi:hypothetical protein